MLRTSWSRFLPEKLVVTQLVKKFPAFVEPGSSLPCSHVFATVPYPEPDGSIQISSHLCLGLLHSLFPSGFLTKVLYAFLISIMCGICPAHLILNQITLKSYETPHYAVFSSLLPLPPS